MNQNGSGPVYRATAGYRREIGAEQINATLSTWLRLSGGALVLAILVWRLGAAPFVAALGSISVVGLAVAAGITVLTTMCCAWRWRLVACGFGVGVPLRTAVAAYYGSQFLNSTLPGGVLGDVHRAVRHGRAVGNVGLGVRAVAWERTLGQVVQVLLTAQVLFLVPSARHSIALVAVAAVAAVGLGLWMLKAAPAGRGHTRLTAMVSALAADLRCVMSARRAVAGILLMSALATAGHTAVFVTAARVAGVDVPVGRLLPVASIVLLVSAVPTHIAGWGPREGAAAWAFGAADLGAAQGVTTCVVYGVMALVATLPGAAVLVAVRRRLPRKPEDAQLAVATGQAASDG